MSHILGAKIVVALRRKFVWGNKRRQTVPMNDEVFDALQEAFKIRTTDHVIKYKRKAVRSVKKAFARLAEDCGLECSPHVLRHTCSATHNLSEMDT